MPKSLPHTASCFHNFGAFNGMQSVKTKQKPPRTKFVGMRGKSLKFDTSNFSEGSPPTSTGMLLNKKSISSMLGKYWRGAPRSR